MRLDWEIAKRGWRRYAAHPWATFVWARIVDLQIAEPDIEEIVRRIYLAPA